MAAACRLNVTLGPVAMLPFLARDLPLASSSPARLSVMSGPGRSERWLIYPSLIFVYVPVTALILLWPVAAAILGEMLLARTP